ncbi:TldD/PmbA family protein [Clostridium cylindrosporum]|uniref:Metalloprotease TldD n=1 Tax=Clostridium cylindrosporum DSM 605 TaxID=1121307 RepID=A0A0J8D4U8_CLOCY|nr:TldD/PmbA family protein [Clostridium cylindrosporum]KMT20842.1 metalloprotease TldD [Clostridium cylindrosporum DSM 605]
MIEKDLSHEILKEALSTGADFGEIYIEEEKINTAVITNGKVEDVLSGKTFGAGIRIFSGLKSVYVHTNNVTREGLLKCARDAASAIKGSGADLKDLVIRNNNNINPIIHLPEDIVIGKKVDKIKEAYKAAKDYSSEIVQVTARYADNDKKVYIANSEGLITNDRRCRTRIAIQSVASDGVENQTGFFGPGKSMGFEFFDHTDVEWYAKEASRIALTMLHADKCPSGNMDVVIDNGFGGVIFHEACGHSLEATSVAKGHSVFSGKLGEKIASPILTAIDDGSIPNEWGSISIDDEGNKGRRNILIENGVLKGYMIDKLNGRRMGMEATGNSRRQSYKYAPTSRMTNTFIAPGKSTQEEIISATNEGIYAKYMGGGSVNPVTGEFNFSVLEGYLIKDGKIDRPVRGATLIGKGSQVLMDIDMIGNNLSMGQGMCGSISGSIPTNVGQPTIRVKNITVGGGK